MARGKKTAKTLTPEEKLQQALVPEKEQPYPIPENWCWCKIASICGFERGITFPASAKEHELTETNIPCLRTANIQDELEIDDLLYVNISYIKNNEEKYVRPDDIIMSSANSRELVGKVSYVYNVPFPMTFGGFVLAIRAKKIYNKYLFYYLRFEFLSGKFIGKSTQTTNIANINTAKLGSYEFPLAPLTEQQRIVSRIESLFAKLDAAKEKAQAVVDGFELRKSAILHKAFTGELAGISGGRTIPLETIVKTIRIGPFGSALHKEDYVTGGLPVINPKHIIDQQIVPEEKVTITEEKAAELMTYALKTGDIVVGRRGEMGRSAPVTEKEDGWLCGTGSLIIRLQDGYNGAFYSQIIASHSSIQYLEENCVGSTMKNLNEKIIKSLPVPNYTREQQKSIVDTLNRLLRKEQQAKEAAEAVLSQIGTMKKAILARAFRGELGTNDPAEESAAELLKKLLSEQN